MRISYNWLKWYIPDAPEAQKLADILTYHLAEVESVDAHGDDFIFEIKILPNRAHDLLSHQGIAREIASLLNINYNDPTPKYKVPAPKPTKLEIKVESDKCRRYTSRIVRNIKVGPSPDWVVTHLESVGQRSINNMVDAANIVMFDCGQPAHVFDLNKIKGSIVVRQAKDGETMTTLDNKECVFTSADLVIADNERVLAVAGVKGGKVAEVDADTTDIVLEVANFDPTSVRKTAQRLSIFTDAKKRFENDLSPELCDFAMLSTSGLMAEYGFMDFEDIVDIYPNKPKEQKLTFRIEKIKSILGLDVAASDIENILKRYNFSYTENGGVFDIVVPSMRLDLVIEEDMAEEIGRIMGYDKVKGELPKISFKSKPNELYAKIQYAREKLLSEGYGEVLTTSFSDKGEVGVLASASDKNYLRTNLSDGLKDSIKLNQVNAPYLGLNDVKVFEIGTVFLKGKEEMHVAYGNKKEIKELELERFVSENASPEEHGYFSAEKFLVRGSVERQTTRSQASSVEDSSALFSMWSLFPFIARDVAVWVPESVTSEQVAKVIKENMGELVVRGPEIFDEFKKEGKTSYAFRLVFQSYDRTLTDTEVGEVMTKINHKLTENTDWQVR